MLKFDLPTESSLEQLNLLASVRPSSYHFRMIQRQPCSICNKLREVNLRNYSKSQAILTQICKTNHGFGLR